MNIPMAKLAPVVVLLLYSICLCLSGDSSHISWLQMLRECFPDSSASYRGIWPLKEFLKQLMIFSLLSSAGSSPNLSAAVALMQTSSSWNHTKSALLRGSGYAKIHRSIIQISWLYLTVPPVWHSAIRYLSLFWTSFIKTKIVNPHNKV